MINTIKSWGQLWIETAKTLIRHPFFYLIVSSSPTVLNFIIMYVSWATMSHPAAVFLCCFASANTSIVPGLFWNLFEELPLNTRI